MKQEDMINQHVHFLCHHNLLPSKTCDESCALLKLPSMKQTHQLHDSFTHGFHEFCDSLRHGLHDSLTHGSYDSLAH